jgi:endonuclease/exonuclease/phosphatase family metal-dependent hydrolase
MRIRLVDMRDLSQMTVRLLPRIAVTIGLAVGASCGPKPIVLVPTHPATRNCDGDSRLVTWRRDPDSSGRLRRWCEGVGTPLVIAASPRQADVRRLLVVSWNIHVGAGRVRALVDRILERTPKPATGEVGIVLLLQEAFRAGAAVPDFVPGDISVPAAIRPDRPAPDVAELAQSMGMSAVYVPSMRNGPSTCVDDREDRGSAILSSEPLSNITAIELPFGKQRRVAVMATVTPVGGTGSPLHVIAGHLDSFVGTRSQAETLAGYLDELKGSGAPVLLGIDTNAVRGRADSAVRALERTLPIEACGNGRTGPWLARLDFIFSNLPEFSGKACETLVDRYGSDHLPILLTIDY